tara:strand:- start:3576 stop:3992 length:417 start_codon:yes stop_codon:yes gene_type:complete
LKLLIENWRRYLNEKETIALGRCYPFANKMADEWMKAHIDRTKPRGKGVHPDIDNKEKFKVIHGRITDSFSGESVLHGWVEKGNLVFDDQTSHTQPEGVPKEDWYEIYQPEPHEEYTAEEAVLQCMKSGHEGPWTDKQ